MDEFNNNMEQNNVEEPVVEVQETVEQAADTTSETTEQVYSNPNPTPVIEGAVEEKDTMATASMVCGIVSIVLGICCGCVGLICAGVAIVLGIIVKVKNKPGDKKALIGIITGGVGVLAFIISCIINIAVLSNK